MSRFQKILKTNLIKVLAIPATVLVTVLFNLVNPLISFPVLAQIPVIYQADKLFQQGLDLFNESKFEEAKRFFNQALEIYQNQGSHPQILQRQERTLINLSNTMIALGNFSKAIEYSKKSLNIARTINDLQGEAWSLRSLGTSYIRLSQYKEAIQYNQQAIQILEQLNDNYGLVLALGNLGVAFYHQGQYPQAFELQQRRLSIAQKNSLTTEVGRAFNDLGIIYYAIGELEKAKQHYQQSLAIAQKLRDEVILTEIYGNLGSVYTDERKYDQAIASYEKALETANKIGDNLRQGGFITNIGTILYSQGKYDEALNFYKKALAKTESIKDVIGKAKTLHNIAAVYFAKKEYNTSLDFYNKALSTFGNSKDCLDKNNSFQRTDCAGIASTLTQIGYTLLVSGRINEATAKSYDAMRIQESLRPGLADASKVSLADKQKDIYEILQQSLVIQNKTEEALEIAERGRAQAFGDLIVARLNNKNTESILPRQPISVKRIQNIASQNNTTLIEYSLVSEYSPSNPQKVEEKLYIWVIQSTGKVEFRKVNLREFLNTSLEKFVNNTRQSIGVRGRASIEIVPIDDSKSENLLKQLHKILIEPIADLLPSDTNARIIFMPQRELFLVPFPALQDTKGKYLIEKHTILTAPAIQVLDLTQQQKIKVQQANSKELVIVGNPTMPKVSPKIGEPPQQLASLPNAELEAKAIAPILKAEAITGNKAKKSAILPLLPKARIIHLATHGLLDDFLGLGVPGAIALAPSGNGELNDGLLTASEILDLKLNAELVVLSACDTGRGKITGDGVIGLSRSLISAGTPSVIVSLWSVPDAPTAELMTEFYRNWQQRKLDKAQALRQAMLTTMKQHPNPKDWAAFTLIGEAK